MRVTGISNYSSYNNNKVNLNSQNAQAKGQNVGFGSIKVDPKVFPFINDSHKRLFANSSDNFRSVVDVCEDGLGTVKVVVDLGLPRLKHLKPEELRNISDGDYLWGLLGYINKRIE